MSWQGIEGQDAVVERFRRILASGRLASTYLFIGPQGVGKRLFAERLAQVLLCETQPEAALDPCGACPGCQQVLAGAHPDLLIVEKPPDKSAIPVELLIGSGEKRMREGLCHDIGLKSFYGRRKVALIDDADYLNVEGANCLLKTLEEPPPRSLLILIGTSLQRQLPTIRSRAQVIRFAPLTADSVAELLLRQGVVSDRAEALRLAQHAEGSLAQARELADPELWQFREELLRFLSKAPLESVAAARRVAAFVDKGGSEAAARRDRLRQIIGFAIDFHRALLRSICGAPLGDDQQLAAAVERFGSSAEVDSDQVCTAIDACLAALGYVDRNVNQATVLEWWLDELRRAFQLAPAAAR
jgi:DNA polymerase-3 subunit delta'